MSKNSTENHYGKWIVAVISLAIFVPNYGQYLLSPFAGEIMDTYHISASQFSSLFTAPMIPAVLLSMVVGALADRFNPKLVVGCALTMSLVGAILSVVSFSYGMLFVSFMLLGVTASTLNGTQAKLIGNWYSPEQVPSKTGIVLSASTISMAAALAVAAKFSSIKFAFLSTVFLGTAALILWLLIYRTPEKPVEGVRSTEKGESDLKDIIRNKNLWIIGFSLFFLMAAHVAVSSFLPTFLIEQGIENQSAGYYSAVYMIGSFSSCYIAPFVLNKVKSRKKTVFLFSILALLSLLLIARYTTGKIILRVVIFLAGLGVGAGMPVLMSMPVTLDGIGVEKAGIAGGFVATLELLGAILLPGYVLIPIVGEGNYSALFILAGICMLICGFLVFLLPKEKIS